MSVADLPAKVFNKWKAIRASIQATNLRTRMLVSWRTNVFSTSSSIMNEQNPLFFKSVLEVKLENEQIMFMLSFPRICLDEGFCSSIIKY